MTRAHPNFTFQSLTGDNPVAAPVLRRAAAGSQFNSPLSGGISPAAAKFPPPTDAAAGTNSNLRYFGSGADAPIDADESGALGANPPASIGNEYTFGSGPSFHKPGSIGQGRARDRVNSSAAAKSNLRRLCDASSALPNPARSRLKFSQIAQAAFDVFSMLFIGLFVVIFGLCVLASVFILLFVRVA